MDTYLKLAYKTAFAAVIVVTLAATGAFAADETLTVGGFPVTLEDYSFSSKNGVSNFTGKGSLDLSAALGSGVVLSSDDVSIDATGKAVFKNATYSGQFTTSGGVTGRIDAADIEINPDSSEPLKIKTIITLDVAGAKVEVGATLPVTPEGIQNTTIALLPKQGDQAFFSYKKDSAELTLGSGTIDITNGKLGAAKFSGSLKIMGSDVTISNVSVTPAISGNFKGGITIGGIQITFPQDSSFSYSQADGFKVSAPAVDIDISKVLPGAQAIKASSATYADGALHAEINAQQTIPVGKASLKLEKIVFDAEKQADGSTLVKASADGAVTLGDSGPSILITGLKFDSAGNVTGKMDLSPPQAVTLLGVSQTVKTIEFSRVKGALTVGMSGSLVLGSDSIDFTGLGMSAGKLTGTFDVSESNPFTLSWFPYLKFTNIKIDNDVLKISGQIDVPAPMSYTFKFNDIQVDRDGNFIKQTSTAVKAAWNKVSDPALVTFENKNPAPLTVAGFSFYVDAITLPNPIAAARKGQFPDTLLKLYLRGEFPIAGNKVPFTADGIEVTKAGLKDATLDVAPPEGQASFFSQTIAGFATVSVSRAKLEISGNKFKSFILLGSIKLSTPSLTADVNITVDENKKATGKASLESNPLTVEVSGLGVTITSVSFTALTKDDISVTLAGSMKIGSGTVGVNSFTINKDGVSAEFDVSESKPFSFSWLPYLKVTQFKIEKSELTFGGGIDVPDPIKYTFAFKDVKFDMNGNIKKQLATAAAGTAKKAWDKVTDADLLTLENTNTTPLKAMGFSFTFSAITLPNPMAAVKNKKFPDTLLTLYMKGEFPLGGGTVTFNVDGLEITKAGLKDVTLDVKPPDGQGSFFSQTVGGFAKVSANKASLSIKDHTFKQFDFKGTLELKTPSLTADVDITVGSGMKISGRAAMESNPLTMSLCGLGVAVTSIDFTVAGKDDITVTLAGGVKIGSDKLGVKSLKIDKEGVAAEFDVSDSKPFSFSWLPYMKVTQLKIDKSELLLGGSVTAPDPVKYTFSFQDVKFDISGNVKGQVAQAAAGAAKKAWEKVASNDLISIVNTNKDPLTVAGFLFYIDAITVPNPFAAVKNKALPDTLLSLYMRCELPLGSQKITVNVDGLEITKGGLKDLTITVAPPDGQESVYSTTFFNWAKFTIDGASLVVKNKKFESFTFTGSVTVDGTGFNISSLTVADGALTGKLQPIGDAAFKLGGVKLAFGGDILFRAAASSKTGAGGGGPPASTSFSITLKAVSLDMTEALGSSDAKVTFNEISYTDGNISADITSPASFNVTGIKFALTKIHFESNRPTQGESRVFKALLNGGVKIFSDQISLDIIDFKVTSAGEIGGVIKPAVSQSFDLYIMSFSVTQLTVVKKPNLPFEFTLAGSLKVGESKSIDFDSLKYSNGKISLTITRTEDQAIALPLFNFVKLTKLVVSDSQLKVSGFMDVPVLNFRMVAEDIAVSTSGKVTGGVFKLGGSGVSVDLGPLKFNISTASLDLATKYVSFSGSISLPKDLISGEISFSNIGMQLSDTGLPAMNTSKSTVSSKGGLEDKKHGFPLTISKTALSFDSGKVVLSLNGTLSFMSKFTLNFENFSIKFNPANVKDVSFSIGSVTGSIEVATFKLSITEFKIDDSTSDPFVKISGGLSLPQFGSVSVTGLEIHKSGAIKLESVSISVDKGAYKVAATISYKNDTFTGAGKIKFAGKELTVSVLFSPSEFKVDISVSGLNIVLFPGVVLDGVGGGVHCKYSPLWLEFKLTADLALGSGNIIKGSVSLTVNTDGVITIAGSLKALDAYQLGEASITIDTVNKKVSGYAKFVQGIGGVVSINAQMSFYFGPDTWYIKGNGTMNVAGYNLGSVSLNISSNGLYLNGSFSYKGDHVSASVTFSFTFVSLSNFSAKFDASASVSFWKLTVSASVSLSASYSNGTLYASAGVRGCITIWFVDVCKSATVYVKATSGGMSIDVSF